MRGKGCELELLYVWHGIVPWDKEWMGKERSSWRLGNIGLVSFGERRRRLEVQEVGYVVYLDPGRCFRNEKVGLRQLSVPYIQNLV
jgi:hypothetical protein